MTFLAIYIRQRCYDAAVGGGCAVLDVDQVKRWVACARRCSTGRQRVSGVVGQDRPVPSCEQQWERRDRDTEREREGGEKGEPVTECVQRSEKEAKAEERGGASGKDP